MEKFEDLQATWELQTDVQPKLTSHEIIEKGAKQLQQIKIKHYGTIAILTLLIFALTYYYFWIYNEKITAQLNGLRVMILVIIVRIILEIISIIQFKKIDFTDSFTNYTTKLMQFYKFRKTIHFIVAPLILISYCIGFIALLPLFKENLSKGFYLYIIWSGSIFLIIFGFIMFKSSKKDIQNLKFLKNNVDDK